MVELYPFGRSMFGFELEPLLKDIRAGKFGAAKAVCSLRDILVEKKDPSAYEERVLQKLNRHFDALLIHSDPEILCLGETFSRVEDINIPVVYTGFIAQQTDAANGRRLRGELTLSSAQKLIVASAGGGRSGYRLLTSVIDACELLRDRLPIRLEVFTGPFMENEEFKISATLPLIDKSSFGLLIGKKFDNTDFSSLDIIMLQIYLQLLDNAYQSFLNQKKEKGLSFIIS